MKAGYVYLAQTSAPHLYKILQTTEESIVSNVYDPAGHLIVHVIQADDPRGVQCYLFGYFSAHLLPGLLFALTSLNVTNFCRIKGRTIDQVACKLPQIELAVSEQDWML